MKNLIIVCLIVISCQSKTKVELSQAKDKASKIYSKGLGEGVAYNIYPIDSMNVYTTRFAKIIIDSSDDYVLHYARAFRYLTNKKIIPTQDEINKNIDNPFIYKMKD
jgi:uncharacterized protein YqfA (UPF0365 family)